MNWLNSPVAEALGWTLLHALWQGFALVLPVAVCFYLMRRSRAVLRYRLGMLALLAQLLASAITFGLYYEPNTAPNLLLSNAALAWWAQSPVLTRPTGLAALQLFLSAHLAQVVGLWLVGVGVFGLRLVGGWVYVQRLRKAATLPVPALLGQTMDKLTQRLAVQARLRVSAQVSSPVVVGLFKPVVLWPVGLLSGLSVADVEAILAHELAHIRRYDYGLNMVQSVVEILYFFHPALWWLSARVREEREHCCDDVAVAVVGDARILARALARVEEWQRAGAETPTLVMAFAGGRQQLLQRVRRMLGVPTQPLVSNSQLAVLTLITLLSVSVSVYAVQQKETASVAATQKRQADMARVFAASQLQAAQVRSDAVRLGTAPAGQAMTRPETSGVDSVRKGEVKAAMPQTEIATQITPVAAQDTARMRAAQKELELLTKQLNEVMSGRQATVERLSKEMAELTRKNSQSQKQLEPLTRQLGQLARQHSALTQKLGPLERELNRLSTQNDARTRALIRQKEAQSRQVQGQMERLEKQMEKLSEQVEPAHTRMEPFYNRLATIGDSINTLYEPTFALTEKIAQLSEQIAEDAHRQAEVAYRRAEEAFRRVEGEVRGMSPAEPPFSPAIREPRAPRAPRTPRMPRPARVPHAAVAPVPPPPGLPVPAAIAPVPEVPGAPAHRPRPPRPARVIRGRAALQPAPAPAPAEAPSPAPKPPREPEE
ncbi:M56 family metallopeptidase [Rudanella paleaurantiibacter]|nr:M56 family metallopeptidase [Rudanella paleaurantiibacter]